MNFKNSVLVIFFAIEFILSVLSSADLALINDQQVLAEEVVNGITSHTANCVGQFITQLSTFDPIQKVVLPILRVCKDIEKPIKTILLDSTETKDINGIKMQYTRVGFLPFHTNFWCTGVRLSIEILAEVLYCRRDYQKYKCSLDDENHRLRVAFFMKKTHFFLQSSQDFIESEINRRRNLIAKYIEIGLDGAILFFESLYDNENDPCFNTFKHVSLLKPD